MDGIMSQRNDLSGYPSQQQIDESEFVDAPCAGRRTLLLLSLAAGACAVASRSAFADDDEPGSSERPQKGDLLVFSQGDHAGSVIKPDDLKLGGPPAHAWPMDPKTKVVRKGSRLNEILLVKLDPAELDDATKPRAADGVVAYSIICAHAGCPVTAWVKRQRGTRMSSSASATTPNTIRARQRKSYSVPLRNRSRRCRLRPETMHSSLPRRSSGTSGSSNLADSGCHAIDLVTV
jgi:hypothetical protein